MATVVPLCRFSQALASGWHPNYGPSGVFFFFGSLGHGRRPGASGADNGEVNAWSAVSGRLASISAFMTLLIAFDVRRFGF